MSLSNSRGKAQDVLFVDGLKHNIMSEIQDCHKRHQVTFTTKD